MANPKIFTKKAQQKEKYHIPLILVIYRRCLRKLGCFFFFLLHQLYLILFIWYLILRGTGADCPPRGPASCSCHVSATRQTAVFVSQIDWVHSPAVQE